MADLTTQYMGLKLKTPIVVGSSGMVKHLDGIRKAADAGAGAVVMKSLFEEQFIAETSGQDEGSSLYGAEASDYFHAMSMSHGPRDYLQTIADVKKATDMPLIASLNCLDARWWMDYAHQLESAGADALELNIAIMPVDPKMSAADVEKRYLEIIRGVKQKVKLPVAVKIGPYFTALAHFARQLVSAGADGLVLFNRFYQFDIDPVTRKIVPGYILSTPGEAHLTLRWMAILSGSLEADLSAATGVHDGLDAAKQILAGANVVQVCSSLFKHGYKHVGTITGQLAAWMDTNHFATLQDFRGTLNQDSSSHPETYERLQYIKALVGEE